MKKYTLFFILLLSIFALLAIQAVNAEEFKLIEGNLPWNNEINGVKGSGYAVYELNNSPKKVEWFWRGEGDFYVYIEYSDGNRFYYVMNGSKPPKVEREIFIDENGVPRIIVPCIVKLEQGWVSLDFQSEYQRYFGSKVVSVSKLRVYFKGSGEFSNFNVEEYASAGRRKQNMSERVYIDVKIPQGNYGKPYLIKNKWLPMEVTVRTLLNESYKTEFLIGGDVEIKENETIKLDIPPGYFEKSLILTVKPKHDRGKIYVELLGLKNRSFEFITVDEGELKSKIRIYDVGVYPIKKNRIQKIAMEKNLKNYIKIREDVFSWFHRLFGSEESFDEPAGFVYCVLDNKMDCDIPLHIKFSVYSEGKEVKFFRGEHIKREEFLGHTPVPETLIVLRAKGVEELKMPVYADVYSIKPGKYDGFLKVSLLGGDTIISERFEFYVGRESQIKTLVCSIAVVLSILSLSTLGLKQKSWIREMRTNELITISLFTAVAFSIVDVPWFVFGDVVRALFGPLGPFMHLFTGIFWDIINASFLVALIWLIPRPGVVIISSVIRIALSSMVFGSFNPVSILLMLSYAALAEFFLYIFGFTSGRKMGRARTFGLIAFIFSIKHVYSTYTFYYIWMYLYRLFYPDWYINLNAVISAIYSALGAIVGVKLGERLRRVIE